MNIELENNSAPLLKEFLEERNIKDVIFDMDGTLLSTDQYYNDALYELGMDIAEHMENSKPSEIIAKEIEDLVFDIYHRNNSGPQLMYDQCMEALQEYLNGDITEEIKEVLEYTLKDFYMISPEAFQSTPRILKAFSMCDVNIGIHSHAQEEWTGIKVESLKELTGIEDIPYLATSILRLKDRDSWINAFEIMNANPSTTLVVGDSFNSDIRPAIEAGCKYLIWIDLKKVGIPKDYIIPNDVEIYVINSIGDILR